MLEPGETHVWLLDLEVADSRANLLSDDERARADAFRFGRHRRRFVSAHSLLRGLLSAYVGAAPEALVLLDGPNGKPELEGHDVRFNLAHSESVGVCAVSTTEVGVDVEVVDRDRRPDWSAVAERFFHPDEIALLRDVGGDAGWLEFLRVWTLKEACLKAVGVGLLTDPRSFSVATVLAGPEVVRLADSEWLARELDPVAGAFAALAVAS